MSQYTIYENLNPNTKKAYPYVMDVQTVLLSELSTRIVIPLGKKENQKKGIITNLNPRITINKKEYVLLTQQLTAISLSQIGSTVCDYISKRQDVLSAIDFLITGV